MKTYTITKCGEAPDWNVIPSLSIDEIYKNPSEWIGAWAQIAWNEEKLFVRLRAQEEEIRAEERGLIGSPCEDSCLEFFFSPMEGDNRYFNIEYNANACIYLGLGVNVQTLVRLIPEDLDDIFFPKVVRFDGGWEVSYEIPYSFIRRVFPAFEAKSGKVIRANCFKCAEKTSRAHFRSWSLIEGVQNTFHRPDCFGTMIFE